LSVCAIQATFVAQASVCLLGNLKGTTITGIAELGKEKHQLISCRQLV